ncbi:uncharacterized protein LOC124271839 [Haliotis rubra]|uniref:uncharacterized protein LOC124271839 n=1 Tax=Haliotis rubra TaxID=36100 RepID=UPI001EE5A9D5|nr:uncharacterized protein LOC124271839 [Haliotis rubra]
MTDILTMVDIIYPKLRIFTDGARTAALIINRLKHGKKQPKQAKRTDHGKNKPRWDPRRDYSQQTWEDNVHSAQWAEDERDSETNVNISENKLTPIEYKAMAAHVTTATTKSWKKSLQLRIVSVVRRLSFCIPRKTIS